MLRYRLYQRRQDAATPTTKKGAIETLQFMKEKGVLMALRHEKGDTGELAKKAFHELMNPKVATKEDIQALQAQQKDKAGGDKAKTIPIKP